MVIFTKKKLGDIAFITKLAGFEHTKYIQGNCSHTKIDETYIPLFIGKTIHDGKIDSNFDWYISKSISDELPRSKLNKKCLIVPYVGSLGDIAIFPATYDAHLGSNVGKIELNDNCGYLEEFVYYYLKSPIGQQYLLKEEQGGVQKNITMEALRNVLLPDLDLPTQKKIADVLFCIDDKIALNNKTNSELENMAKTVYDYWFTQFDFPDANGNPYKTSGGKMEYNPVLKREIPVGWEVKNIQECCKIIDCLHSKKPDYCFEDENCYLLQLENLIDLKLIDLSNKYYVSKEDYKVWTSKTKVKQGDLVVTNAGRVGGVSRIPSYIETGIGRNMTSIRPTDISEYVLCYFFSSTDCDNQIKANTDQGAFFQSLNVKGIKQINLTIPPKEIQSQFDDFVGKMRLQIETIHQENEELIKLRDYLLPLLMNGQIEVN